MLAIKRFRRDLEDPNSLLEALGRRVRLVSQAGGESDQTHEPSPLSSGDTDKGDNQGNWSELFKLHAPDLICRRSLEGSVGRNSYSINLCIFIDLGSYSPGPRASNGESAAAV